MGGAKFNSSGACADIVSWHVLGEHCAQHGGKGT